MRARGVDNGKPERAGLSKGAERTPSCTVPESLDMPRLRKMREALVSRDAGNVRADGVSAGTGAGQEDQDLDQVGQFFAMAGSYPRLTAEDEKRIGQAIAEHRKAWERALFSGDAVATYTVNFLQRYIDTNKRIDRFCVPIPGKQKDLKARMEARRSIIKFNLKTLHPLLAKNAELYKIALSKRLPSTEREAAWKQLGRNKEKIATLLGQCKIRFEILLRIHKRFAESAEEIIERSAQNKKNDEGVAQRTDPLLQAESRRALIGDLIRWRESRRSLASRHERCLDAFKSMKASMDELTNSNFLLVGSIVKEFYHAHQGDGHAFMILVSGGNEGLLRAVEKFDWKRKCKFSTIATPWIKQGVRREILKNRALIHVPAHMVTAQNALRRDNPSSTELNSLEVGTPLQQNLRKAYCASAPMLSLDESATNDESAPGLGALIPSRDDGVEVSVARQEAKDLVHQVLREAPLTPRERDVIEWRFIQHMTLEECKKRLCVSRERVRQIEINGKGKFKDYVENVLGLGEGDIFDIGTSRAGKRV
jgi:RNA polymerase sigma factor (sigma-70 family)